MPIRLYPHIVIDPDVLSSLPVIEGTQVPASTLIARVATGKQIEEVAHEHDVTVADVRASLEYAAKRVGEPQVPPRPEPATADHTPSEQLSPAALEEARRIGLDISNISPLGRDLLEIRAQAAAAGEQFLSTWEELDAEIADRCGGVYPYPDADE